MASAAAEQGRAAAREASELSTKLAIESTVDNNFHCKKNFVGGCAPMAVQRRPGAFTAVFAASCTNVPGVEHQITTVPETADAFKGALSEILEMLSPRRTMRNSPVAVPGAGSDPKGGKGGLNSGT